METKDNMFLNDITQVSEPVPPISTGTVVRTVWLGVAILNYFLSLFNLSPVQLNNEFVNEFVDLSFLVIPAIWSWWKNNSFTKAASIGDRIMEEIKPMIKNESEGFLVGIDIEPVENNVEEVTEITEQVQEDQNKDDRGITG